MKYAAKTNIGLPGVGLITRGEVLGEKAMALIGPERLEKMAEKGQLERLAPAAAGAAGSPRGGAKTSSALRAPSPEVEGGPSQAAGAASSPRGGAKTSSVSADALPPSPEGEGEASRPAGAAESAEEAKPKTPRARRKKAPEVANGRISVSLDDLVVDEEAAAAAKKGGKKR